MTSRALTTSACHAALHHRERRGMNVNPEMRKYFQIGRKGGRANKGKATEKCRAAAHARWAAVRAAKHEEEVEEEEETQRR